MVEIDKNVPTDNEEPEQPPVEEAAEEPDDRGGEHETQPAWLSRRH